MSLKNAVQKCERVTAVNNTRFSCYYLSDKGGSDMQFIVTAFDGEVMNVVIMNGEKVGK